MSDLHVRRVVTRAEKRAFVDVAYALNAKDPNWVPPLKDEVRGLITPGKNPWFEHAEAAFFLAWRASEEEPVGRISAQIDALVLEHMGAGLGQWGMFEAADEEAAHALLAAAEEWLRSKGMSRAMGPFSLGIWDEPGLLIEGHDHRPMVMMGHHKAQYQGWVERAGYAKAKDLYTYDTPVTEPFPPLIGRIVAAGEKNPRIHVRKVDPKRFDEEAALILAILNDAWSDNWGFIPLTPAEIAYAGKKLKPIVLDEIIRVAELDGEPVAFMLSLPDINELIGDLKGELWPFNWAKLLWRLRRRRYRQGRVALMGVVKRLQSSRMASQLAFMMIEHIRRGGTAAYGMKRAEVGWILEDNQGMVSIAEAIEARRNRVYRIYEKTL
jgi:GNAT superfamily N-acetyltransferase